jgi:hypothetical protein
MGDHRLDVGDAITSVENSMRDLISRTMEQAHGTSWLDYLGVTPERIESWRQRREEEPKRRPGGAVDDRLMYYSDFRDLASIVKKNWEHFRGCFGDKRRFEVYTDRLLAFRNPDAHSRALLPFEEHLAVGMAGELRQEITLFLSSGAGAPEPEYFARIEEVRDSYGLRAVGHATGPIGSYTSEVVLRPGDRVTFHGRAWDPHGGALTWRIRANGDKAELEGPSFEWEWTVKESDIGEGTAIWFVVASDRPYSRFDREDDLLQIRYRVLPPRP